MEGNEGKEQNTGGNAKHEPGNIYNTINLIFLKATPSYFEVILNHVSLCFMLLITIPIKNSYTMPYDLN
ncbi:MAG: hypothetical protein ACI9IP_002248 [Arcticibacterium sp.]|jgi:hypothetical protein